MQRTIFLLLLGSSWAEAQQPPVANSPYVNPYTPGLSPYNPGVAAANPFGYQQNYYNPTYQTVSPTLSLFLGGSPPLTNYAAPQALANRSGQPIAARPFPIGALSPLRYGFLNLSGTPNAGGYTVPQGGADVLFLSSTGRPASYQGFLPPGLNAPPATRTPFAGTVTGYEPTEPKKK